MPDTPLLDTVKFPADMRGFDIAQLKQLADEVRAETIDAVSVTGGHLGAGLGVVELTTALHHVFETPRDILIWDVGHQCYPHKILTGRRDRIRTLRQGGGLSGFTKRSESAYDPFGAAHAGTEHFWRQRLTATTLAHWLDGHTFYRIERDRSFGVVEFAKAASSARCPLSGTLLAVNEALLRRPGLINQDCYGEGWMVRL